MHRRTTFDNSPFLLDSVHQYTGTAVPHQMLSQDFEAKFLAQVLQNARNRAEECRNRSEANKRDRDRSDAASKFVTKDTIRELEGLRSLQEQAYFGRVDLAISDNEVSEALYIGRSTLMDTRGNFFVYDWRNPIGELFYQNHRGKAYYKTRSGTIQGQILLNASSPFKARLCGHLRM